MGAAQTKADRLAAFMGDDAPPVPKAKAKADRSKYKTPNSPKKAKGRAESKAKSKKKLALEAADKRKAAADAAAQKVAAMILGPDITDPTAPNEIQRLYKRPDMVGNSLWRFRKVHTNAGRPRTYESPQQLLDEAHAYFEWMESNPLIDLKVTQFGGEPVEMAIPKMRAMTKTSLFLHLSISSKSWDDYAKRPEFADICAHIEAVMYSQKLEGAAAGLLDSNIITRELGLKDRTDHTSGDDSIGAIVRTIVDDADKRGK